MESWCVLVSLLTNRIQSYNYSFEFKIYLRLFSGISFIIIDTIIGILIMILISNNVSYILGLSHTYFKGIHIEQLNQDLEWMMGFPAGFKTYRQLNYVIGFTISQLIYFWNIFTTILTPFEPLFLQVTSVFGFFGFSFVVCLVNDLINIFTIHIYFTYKLMTFFYRAFQYVISHCYRIMKDRQPDATTNKNLDHFYSLDYKILALSVFILLIAAYPTILMYYIAYLFITVVIYLIKIILNGIVHTLNIFPLYILYSYYGNKDYFPNQISLTIQKVQEKQKVAQVAKQYKQILINLDTKTISPSFVFAQFQK